MMCWNGIPNSFILRCTVKNCENMYFYRCTTVYLMIVEVILLRFWHYDNDTRVTPVVLNYIRMNDESIYLSCSGTSSA